MCGLLYAHALLIDQSRRMYNTYTMVVGIYGNVNPPRPRGFALGLCGFTAINPYNHGITITSMVELLQCTKGEEIL